MAWKEIEGYKHPYRISDMGEIQSYYSGAWRNMKPRITGWRRACVELMRKDGTRANTPVSRLMVNAFMGGQREGYCIVHKDGDRMNNALWNLKFETRKNACVLGGKTKRKPVIMIDQDGNELEIYPSVAAAAKANFMSPSAVASRCRREMENPFLRCEWDFRYEDEKVGRPKKRRGVKRNEQ